MKTLIVVQARVGSTRLPGKILLPLAGEPLLVRMLERVSALSTPCEVVVATTTAIEDDAVRKLCVAHGFACYSGHPTDLLDRHYRVARERGADLIVKIPSDCPLIDPSIIDRVLTFAANHAGQYDYVSNLHPATYPDGNDVELMTFSALQEAWEKATKRYEREHTTPFLWDRPDRSRIGNVANHLGKNMSMDHRWTIDYPEDYEFIRSVYDRLWSRERPLFTMEDILDLEKQFPDIALINKHFRGVNWYRHHLSDLKTIRPDETLILAGTQLERV